MRVLLAFSLFVRGCGPSYQLAFHATPSGLVCGLVHSGETTPFLTWTPPPGHACDVSQAPRPYNWLKAR